MRVSVYACAFPFTNKLKHRLTYRQPGLSKMRSKTRDKANKTNKS